MSEPAKSSAEDRINALVAERDTAASRAARLDATNTALANKVASLETMLAKLAKPSGSPGSPPPAQGPAGSSDDPLDLAALVRSAVSEAVKPILEKDAQRDAQSHLRTQHQQAYTIAAAQNPDLQDPGSALSQIVEKLWTARPDIASLPDAPIVFANLGRGVLADQKAADVVAAERKRRASVTDGAGRSDSARPDIRPTPSEEAIKETRDRVFEKGITTEGSAGAFTDLFRASLTQALVDQQKDQ